MRVKIESVSDIKVTDRGTSAKMMAGGHSYYINEDPTQHIGKEAEITVEEKTSAKGNKYSIAKITQVYESAVSAAGKGGAPTWTEYEQLARVAHALAMALEPSMYLREDGSLLHDRSTARMAFVNSTMIAFTNGKLVMDAAGDDDAPF